MTDRLKYWQRARLIFGAELGSREKLVLLAISDHLGSNATAWPSWNRLAARTGLSERTVSRSLERMEAQEVINVQRVTGKPSRYSINLDWLKANPCHSDTTPLSESHPCQTDTPVTVTPPPCHSDTTPLSESHHSPVTVTPKGDQEGDQQKEIRKEIKPARKSKRQTKAEAAKAEELRLREEVKAVKKPDGLPDGYAELFDLWIDVRKNPTAWTKHESQTVRFHKKMLKAHQQRKDIMRDLGLAHENGWQGVDVSRMHDLPISVSIDPDKPRRSMKSRAELLADYRKTLELS